MKAKNLLTAALALSTLTACRANNPPLTAPPRAPLPKVQYKVVESSREGLVVEFDTRVDILFIIDDSRSMERHQKKLSENINAFVDEIAKIKAIDFHIGYTVAHDSRRYEGGIVPRTCAPETDSKGRDTSIPNWEDAGTLRPLKGPIDKLGGRRYVTPEDDYREILKASLDPLQNKFLVKDLINKTTEDASACPYGPENEELFTPLLGAVTNPVVINANKGFRRDGALFIAIIVSDAKDASGKSAHEVKRRVEEALADSTNKRKFRAFAVAIKPGLEIGPGSRSWNKCRPDPAFADGKDSLGNYSFSRRVVTDEENPLAEIAQLTENGPQDKVDQVLSICDENYGLQLAGFGKLISEDALTDLELQLHRRWDVTNPEKALKVFIGNTELVEGQHWKANPYSLKITVFGQKIDWNQHKNEKIRVLFTPALDAQLTTKPLKKL